jgi:predicted PurR-regulated permease PerM
MNAATATALQRSFYAVGLLVGVVLILYVARIILVPLALAMLLAFILTPLVDWLERHHLRRGLAVLLAACVALLVVGGVGWAVTTQIANLGAQLQEHEQEYQANIRAKLTPVLGLLESAKQVEEIGKGVPENPAGPVRPAPTPVVVEEEGFRRVLAWLPGVVWPVLEVGGEALLVVVLAIFILFQRETLRDRLLRLHGHGHLASATRALNDTEHRVSRYLLLQLLTNTMVGLGVAIGLYFIGVQYAVLWGLLVAALRFIPYVGVWVAALLPLTLTMAIFPGWTESLLVVGLFLVLELVTANAVEPILFGHGTGVAPLPLLVAAIFWSWLWGPAGLLLSTPLTVCLVVLGRHVRPLRFLDVLLGEREALDVRDRYYQRLLAGDQDDAADLLYQRMQDSAPEAVFDDLVIPALVRARADREEDEVTPAEERTVLHATRALINSTLTPDTEASDPTERTAPPPMVLGCPAHGARDGLALRLFGLVLQSAGCELKLVSPQRVVEEAQALNGQGQVVIVCIAAVPPGGLWKAAHLCRRLRARVPAAKVLVGRWGGGEDAATADARLRALGAEWVGTTLHESVEHVGAALGVPQLGAPAANVPAGSPEAAAQS